MGDGIVYPVRFMDEDSESLLGNEDRQYDEPMQGPFRTTSNGLHQVTLRPYHDAESPDDDKDEIGTTTQSGQMMMIKECDEVVVNYQRSPLQNSDNRHGTEHSIIDFA